MKWQRHGMAKWRKYQRSGKHRKWRWKRIENGEAKAWRNQRKRNIIEAMALMAACESASKQRNERKSVAKIMKAWQWRKNRRNEMKAWRNGENNHGMKYR
jgi:hypothetical protein